MVPAVDHKGLVPDGFSRGVGFCLVEASGAAAVATAEQGDVAGREQVNQKGCHGGFAGSAHTKIADTDRGNCGGAASFRAGGIDQVAQGYAYSIPYGKWKEQIGYDAPEEGHWFLILRFGSSI